MACQTLLRRKTQLALLERVCREQVGVHVRVRRRAAGAGQARFVARERDGVLMCWTGDHVADVEVSGQPVDVRFEFEGAHYVFSAVSRGSVQRELDGAREQTLLKLSTPLRLERARRRHPRLTFENQPPIMSTFTHVIDDRRQFPARIMNVADGGLGVVARTADVSQLFTGDLFWVDLELPGEEQRTEFVVRLVHLRPVRGTDEVALGWAFQPMDDTANYEKYLRRLAAFVAKRPAPGGGPGAD